MLTQTNRQTYLKANVYNIRSSTHTHTQTHTRAPRHAHEYGYTYPRTHSLAHSLTYSLTFSLTHSLLIARHKARTTGVDLATSPRLIMWWVGPPRYTDHLPREALSSTVHTTKQPSYLINDMLRMLSIDIFHSTSKQRVRAPARKHPHTHTHTHTHTLT